MILQCEIQNTKPKASFKYSPTLKVTIKSFERKLCKFWFGVLNFNPLYDLPGPQDIVKPTEHDKVL